MIPPDHVYAISLSFKHLFGLGIVNVKTLVDESSEYPFTSRIYLTCGEDLLVGFRWLIVQSVELRLRKMIVSVEVAA
jgi:hypothetical protein